jgi:hypothetical protein
MGAWAAIAGAAAAHVADRPRLWVAGGLAWLVTVGWLALVVGVARPPTVGELTAFGAGMATSGAWPWNLVAILAVVLAAAIAAASLAAAGEAALLGRHRFALSDLRRALGISAVCGVPVVLAAALLAIGFGTIAVIEFNAPVDGGGPLARIALRLLPLIGLGLVMAWAAGALHAAAARGLGPGRSVLGALRQAPRSLRAARGAALTHTVVATLLRIGYLVLAALLLRVLWAPIEARLVLGQIDLAAALLLVGFVAIWLCLVLAGGALHAWGSLTWTRILESASRTQEERVPAVESPAQP